MTNDSIDNKELLNDEDRKDMQKIGIGDGSGTSAQFIMANDEVAHSTSVEEGVEVLPLRKAIAKYEWVNDILWSLVDKDKDEYTRMAYDAGSVGSFTYVAPGVKTVNPVQTCFFIKLNRFKQAVHNIIVVGEGAELQLLTGCATAHYINSGLHAGITEIVIRKGGKLTYTMIHDWDENVEVRPRTAIRIEEGGMMVNNYISMRKTKMLQSKPTAYLVGKGASAVFNSLIYAPEGAYYDSGAKIVLSAPETSGQILSRSVSNGGTVIARADIVAEVENVKGHVECDSLITSEQGHILAVPVLETTVGNVELSHEAAVGKISEEEINYLMSRGFSSDEAKSIIVKGFMDIDIFELPDSIRPQVEKALDMLNEGGI